MDRSPGNRTARPLATIRLTSRVAIAWLAVSVVGFFVSAYAFGHVLAVARGRPLEPIVIAPPSPTGTVLWLLASGVLVALVVVLHETIHGFAMARFGNAPRFGIGVSHFLLPYAYAETEGTNYTRTQLIVVLLAPLALITAGGVALVAIYPTPLLLVVLAANVAGSVGDVWIAAALCRYPADVRVSGLPDGEQGFGVYPPPDRPIEFDPGSSLLSSVTAGAVGTLTLLVTALFGIVILSLAFGSGTVVIGDPDGRWFLVRHELRTHGRGALLEVGTPLVLAITLAGAIFWAIVTELRRRAA
ncbi:DUF3267 domain-containing protein [Natrialba swarupiae]|uniref:DUF3267 domain-containing protein n=1 Tax=Natrialba swarupiae TaxID=2448032 RepID=A0A5D5ANM9_9EURY|nr:DUF3267 domain-containing protein [Natrialba swarupiae]TYT61050.1 DUF3267 domain-containing protein [Natrialba swarupiae]